MGSMLKLLYECFLNIYNCCFGAIWRRKSSGGKGGGEVQVSGLPSHETDTCTNLKSRIKTISAGSNHKAKLLQFPRSQKSWTCFLAKQARGAYTSATSFPDIISLYQLPGPYPPYHLWEMLICNCMLHIRFTVTSSSPCAKTFLRPF